MPFTCFLLVALLYSFHPGYTKRSQFTVWLPSGRLVYLPSNLDGRKLHHLGAHRLSVSNAELVKANLLDNVELGVVTIWYNALGRIIHVGGVLPISLPMIAPGEVDHEFSRTASTDKSEKVQTVTLKLPKGYSNDLGSSLDTLLQKTMTTITSRTYKSKNAGPLSADLPQEQTFSLKEELVHNQYSLTHYIQPLIIWRYVVPRNHTSMELPSVKWWYSEAGVFCRKLRNVRAYQISPCMSISLNHVSTNTSQTDQTLLSLTINLSTNPLNLLSDPKKTNIKGNITLSYIHAVAKNMLDQHFTKALSEDLSLRNVSTKVAFPIYTSVDITCPTGTQLKHSASHLSPLAFNFPSSVSHASDTSRSPVNPSDSAYALITASLTCELCPRGHAPREPYSFSPCVPCPPGFFRGETDWPSASGCLACPTGFTTLREGSTSPDDCVIAGGPLATAIFGFAMWAYRNFMELIVAAHETSMSYTKRTKFYLSEESNMRSSEGSAHWINRIKPGALAVGIFYSLLVILLLALFLHRLFLICRFKKTHARHTNLLKKSIVIGQLNSLDDVKDLLRQEYEDIDKETSPLVPE